MKPDLHPAHSGETIQPRGPGRICPLSPRGRPTSAAARPPQCGLYWLPSAAASGLGIAVDLKDHDWRHNVGNHGLPDPRLKIMISQFSLWFSDRDIYIVEIDSIRQICFHTVHIFSSGQVTKETTSPIILITHVCTSIIIHTARRQC